MEWDRRRVPEAQHEALFCKPTQPQRMPGPFRLRSGQSVLARLWYPNSAEDDQNDAEDVILPSLNVHTVHGTRSLSQQLRHRTAQSPKTCRRILEAFDRFGVCKISVFPGPVIVVVARKKIADFCWSMKLPQFRACLGPGRRSLLLLQHGPVG